MIWRERTGYGGNVFQKAAWWAGYAFLCAIALAAWACNSFR